MAINNPYIPGDPYSYDLKWIVAKVKEILLQLGTLDEAIEKKIFEGFVEHSIVQFHNVADMLAADIKDGSIVLTLGYHEAGDQGGLFYLVKDFNPSQCALDYFLTLDNNKQIAIPVVVTPYVTPEMFGAYGDGSNDDSQACAIAFSYDHVNIPDKSYKISESIALHDNMIINCSGTVLDYYDLPAGQSEYIGLFNGASVSNIVINGLNIQGREPAAGNYIPWKALVNFEASKNIQISGGKITDTLANWAIRCGSCDGVTVERVHIERYGWGGIGNLNGGKRFKVLNCELIDAQGYSGQANIYNIMLNGYEMTPYQGMPMGEDLQAIGNYIRNAYPFWECIDAHGGKNIVVADNICENCFTGIAVFSDPTRYFYTYNVTVTGNVVNGATTGTARAVDAHGIVCDADTFICSNNVIKNAGLLSTSEADGIYTRTGQNGIISNNVIVGAKQNGIRIAPPFTNLIIENNVISDLVDLSGTNCGIMFRSTMEATFFDVFVKNNTIKNVTVFFQGPYNPLLIDRSAYVAMIGNTYIGSGTYARRNTLKPDTLDQNSVVSVKMGRIGDRIYNEAPTSGQPVSWVCTQATGTNQDAVWTAEFTL